MGVPRQWFGGGAICWAPSPLPSPLSTLVIVVSVIVVSGGVSHCVVVVVSDGGGDS